MKFVPRSQLTEIEIVHGRNFFYKTRILKQFTELRNRVSLLPKAVGKNLFI